MVDSAVGSECVLTVMIRKQNTHPNMDTKFETALPIVRDRLLEIDVVQTDAAGRRDQIGTQDFAQQVPVLGIGMLPVDVGLQAQKAQLPPNLSNLANHALE